MKTGEKFITLNKLIKRETRINSEATLLQSRLNELENELDELEKEKEIALKVFFDSLVTVRISKDGQKFYEYHCARRRGIEESISDATARAKTVLAVEYRRFSTPFDFPFDLYKLGTFTQNTMMYNRVLFLCGLPHDAEVLAKDILHK